MKPYIAVVRWVDIADIQSDEDSVWYTQAEAIALSKRKDSEAVSIGWILDKNRTWVVVASILLEGHGEIKTTYSSIHKIPAGCVLSIRRMK